MYTLINISIKTKALTRGYKITFGKVMYAENYRFILVLQQYTIQLHKTAQNGKRIM